MAQEGPRRCRCREGMPLSQPQGQSAMVFNHGLLLVDSVLEAMMVRPIMSRLRTIMGAPIIAIPWNVFETVSQGFRKAGDGPPYPLAPVPLRHPLRPLL